MGDPLEMGDSSTNVGHNMIQMDNLPRCFDLLAGPGEYYSTWGAPLHRAAMENDWKTAEGILRQLPNLATAVIDAGGMNVLHVAAGANSSAYFIKQLVDKYFLRPEDLALQTRDDYCTALAYLAQSGDNVEAAKVMIEKNASLALIGDDRASTPVDKAVDWGNRRMAWYLLHVTDLHQLPPADRFLLLTGAIYSDLYDVALELVNRFPDLALYTPTNGQHALLDFAKGHMKQPSTPGWWWTQWISGRNEARQNKIMEDKRLELFDKLWGEVLLKGTKEDRDYFGRTILDAAKAGNVEFVAKMIGTYPSLIWHCDENGTDIFGLAILSRQAEMFNLIHEIRAWKRHRLCHANEKGNIALHLAAELPPVETLSLITGAALQMQRELLWFKEVESHAPAMAKGLLNNDNCTPHSLFIKNHETLRKDGEKWMKTTATSCFVVAALVATVAFTSAVTVPGGDDQQTGLPIFQRNPSFVTFAIADALSLLSSSIAMLMFMGILTSRYVQDDFLKSLPLKLLIGLTTLFIAIAFMMVAFALSFFILFKAGSPFTSIPIVVAALASIPVAIFGFSQFPLLIDIYCSTYKAKHLFQNNHKIYREEKNVDPNYFLKIASLFNCLKKNF